MRSAVEVDAIDEGSWNELTTQFSDLSIYQTWSYEAVKSGEEKLSHLVVRQAGNIVAAVQARVLHLPYINCGLAYVRWGPMSRRSGDELGLDALQRALQALRTEYVERRGLSVRILPRISGESNDSVRAILEHEGYAWRPGARVKSTILIDLRPSLDDLYRGLHHKWRYHLNKARRQKLTVVEGDHDECFLHFERIHREMVRRKRLVNFVDVTELKKVQRRLPPSLKMRVFLCSADGDFCAAGICSAIGDTALYLFGATSDRGMTCDGSYLVHWNMLAWAKSQACQSYDLNGIDPVRNAGGYQFKRQLSAGHGREVSFVGEYDAHPSRVMQLLMAAGDFGRQHLRRSQQFIARYT
jgi:hypothetical protein